MDNAGWVGPDETPPQSSLFGSDCYDLIGWRHATRGCKKIISVMQRRPVYFRPEANEIYRKLCLSCLVDLRFANCATR